MIVEVEHGIREHSEALELDRRRWAGRANTDADLHGHSWICTDVLLDE